VVFPFRLTGLLNVKVLVPAVYRPLSVWEVPRRLPLVLGLSDQIWNEVLPEIMLDRIEMLETDQFALAPVVICTAWPLEALEKKAAVLPPETKLRLLKTTAPSTKGVKASAARAAASGIEGVAGRGAGRGDIGAVRSKLGTKESQMYLRFG
jgi:hypothetical protein